VAADLRERCATRSLNDSDDVPTNLLTATDAASTWAFDGLVSQVGQMDIGDVEERRVELGLWGEEMVAPTSGVRSAPQAVRGPALDRNVVLYDDEEEDGDADGAKL
jgi:hypothetical protein